MPPRVRKQNASDPNENQSIRRCRIQKRVSAAVPTESLSYVIAKLNVGAEFTAV
jgi:hypothetical protein